MITAAEQLPFDPDDRVAVDRGIRLGLGTRQTPGLAVAVVRAGRISHFQASGLADLASSRPITPQTIFRVGSISKVLTAIAVLQLVQDGQVELDQPMNSYLRSASIECAVPGAPPITVRQLLTHTSGLGELRRLGDLLVEPYVGLAMPPGQPPPRLADFYREPLTTKRPAGQGWAYANHGFGLLGLLVEDVTGREFSEHLRAEVLIPLGMATADFVLTDQVRHELATGYTKSRRGHWRAVPHWEIAPYPAGNLYASVTDLARLAAALLGRGANEHGRVLSPVSFDLLVEPQSPGTDPRTPRMGLGVWLGDESGLATVSHDGGWMGFLSSLLVAPEEDLAVIALTNSEVEGVNQVAAEVARALTGRPSRLAQVASLPQLAADESGLVGSYGAPSRDLNLSARFRLGMGEVEILRRCGNLWLRTLLGPMRRPLQLHDAGQGLFVVHDGQGSLLYLRPDFDAQGRVEALWLDFERLPRLRGPSTRQRIMISAAAGVAVGAAVVRGRRQA